MPILIQQIIACGDDQDIQLTDTTHMQAPQKEYVVINHPAMSLDEWPQVFINEVEIPLGAPGTGFEYEIFRVSYTQSVLHINRQPLPIGEAVIGDNLIVVK